MRPSDFRSALLPALAWALLGIPAPAAAQRDPVPATPVERGGSVAEATDREPVPAAVVPGPEEDPVEFFASARLRGDILALEQYRPGYGFWSHVFSTPDGAVLFGSAETGQLLATFSARGEWGRDVWWQDDDLGRLVDGEVWPRRLDDRRQRVADLLTPLTGPVIHNPSRGDFVTPNARLYGPFLEEWGRIYERFGVPAEIGLGQALIESGFSGEVKSEARAIGFCQWLPRNWQRLDRLTSHVIEVENQTTQAAYCAAYLTVLATKYGSFIPALSEHHAGSTNVGRTVINGTRLGGEDIRERYLVGAEFAKDVRELSPRTFRDVVGTYGPRSYRYAEMVFGNMSTVERIRSEYEQEAIHAMRAPRNLTLTEIVRATGLSQREVKRFNPALVRQVPRGATVYLPTQVDAFGPDVAFWHRPAPADYQEVLYDFLRLSVPLEDWDSPQFESVLQGFRQRFRATGVEEGVVMDAVLGYVIQEIPALHRQLAAYRVDPTVDRLLEEGLQLRSAAVERAPAPARR